MASDPGLVGICSPAASTSPSGGLEDVHVNPVTKLVVPGPNCAMLPASGCTGPIPPGYFIHPDTGRVLPEAGNLGYDLQEATLVPTTDSSSGETLTTEWPPPSAGLPGERTPGGSRALLGQWGLVMSRAVKASSPFLTVHPCFGGILLDSAARGRKPCPSSSHSCPAPREGSGHAQGCQRLPGSLFR